jgi:hypothetical protein
MKTTVERVSNGLYILLFGLVLLWITLGFSRSNVVFQLLRLWPLFFVVAGIEIIFRKTKYYYLKIISTIIVICSVVGIIYISQGGSFFHQNNIEIFKINQEISSDKTADLNIDLSFGVLFIDNTPGSAINGNLSILAGNNPEIDFKEFEKEDLYEISNNNLSNYAFGPWDDNHIWDIRIGKNVISKAKAKTYASKNKFNFSNLKTLEFTLDTKVSSSEIILNESIKKVRISSFASELIILIPRDMGVKISLNKFLITDNFKELGMERGLKEYNNLNYKDKDILNKMDIDLDLKLSKLEIKYY